MTSKKTTRRALFSSVISLILCFSMLVGTTFAWFTDEVISDRNLIAAGNLDVELYHSDKNGSGNVDAGTKLFDDVTPNLWEPGALAYENLQVKNVGTLALKYQLNLTVLDETVVDGHKLSEVIKVGLVSGGVKGTTREAVIAEVKNSWTPLSQFKLDSSAKPLAAGKDAEMIGIVLYWQPNSNEIDNLYNMNNEDRLAGNVLKLDIGVNLYATQLEAESDSFGPDYDEDAWVDGFDVYTEQDLNAAIANGETAIDLMADIVAEEAIVIPEGATVNLNLNGKTIDVGYQADSTTKHIYAIENRGTLTLKNGTVNARGIANYGTLIVEDGVYNAVDNNGGAAIWNYAGSYVEVNGGTFTAAQATAAPAATVMHVADGATAVVNGGTFKSDADWTYAILSYGDLTINDANVSGEHGAIAAETGNLTINGGTYEITASGHLIYSTAATINLNGGSFKHSQIGASSEGNVILYASGSAKATVNGGSYDSVEGAFAYSSMTGNIVVTGGTFANKATTVYSSTNGVADFVASGYEVKDNGNGTYTVQLSQDSLDSLIENAGPNDTIEVPAGEYTFPASELQAGQTLNCAPGTVFEGKTSLNIDGATVVGATFTSEGSYLVNQQTVNGTFKNCVFTNSDGLRYCEAGENVVFEDCVFDTDFYGVHFNGGANDVVFKRCTFTGFNTFGAALTNLTMEDCTFKYNGKGGYNGVNLWGNAELTRCTFVFDGSASTEWVDLVNDNKTVTFTDCVVTDGTNETPIEEVVGNYGTGNTITVDGTPVVFFNDDLKTAVANGETKVLLREGEYDLNGIQKDGLTLVGIGENVKMANTTKYASGKSVGAIWKAIHLENMTITNTVYTMADGGNATFTNVYFAAGFRQGYGKNVVFTDCTFGSNSEGYALHFQTDSASEGGVIKLNGCEFEEAKVHLGGKRTYEFTNCDFAAGTDFQVWSNITLDGCTVNGEKVTAENIATLFPNLDQTKVTIK